MFSILVSMFIFALVGAISPGPVNIIATGTGASFGFRKTIPHILGATFAYTFIVFIAGTSLNILLEFLPGLTKILQFMGGAFLLYMAYKIANSKPINQEVELKRKAPNFLEGALAQGLNPKAWIVSMSGVSLFVTSNSPSSMYLFFFCIISFIVCFIGVGTWASIGHLIGKYLSKPKHFIRFNILMALLLCSTVLSIFMNS